MKAIRIGIIIFNLILVWAIIIVSYPFLYSKYIFAVPAFRADGVINIVNNEDFEYKNALVLGDSTSIGQGTNGIDESYSYTFLKTQQNNYNYLNLGYTGATSQDTVDNQISKIGDFVPDIVFISTGSNDVIKFQDEDQFSKNIENIYQTIKDYEVIWMNIPNFMTAPTILPPANLYLNSKAEAYNKYISNFCTKIENSFCIDIYTDTFDDFKSKPETYFSKDKFHPSKKGYDLWSELINKERQQI